MVAEGYARTYRANSVLTASPGQLVLMLFDGALKAMNLALDGFDRPLEDRRRIEVINKHLLKAQMILSELQSGLNLAAGGEFAQTMYRLYEYHNRRLFEANIRKDPTAVREVERLVMELRDAWAQMLSQQDSVSVGVGMRGVA